MSLQPHLERFQKGEIKPVRLVRVKGGRGAYSIYGYTCLHLIFDDGTWLSTGQWQYPDTKKTENRLREAFKLGNMPIT